MDWKKFPRSTMTTLEIEKNRPILDAIMQNIPAEQIEKEMGVSRYTTARWKMGEGFPTRARMNRLIRYYGELLGGNIDA